MRWTLCMMLCALVVCAGSATAQVFSLDDNPAAPMTSPPGVIPGTGAEDPFGLGSYPLLAPSPSLGVGPFLDGDLMVPGPNNVPLMDYGVGTMGGPLYLDSISANASAFPMKVPQLHLAFSVDRVAMGLAGSAVAAEAAAFQAPADIYRTDARFPHPVSFAGIGGMPGFNGALPPVGTGLSNLMLWDDSRLTLTPAGAPGALVGPGIPVPPPAMGTHDNVDGFNLTRFDRNGDLLNDMWAYGTTNPDQAIMSGVSAADIFDAAAGNVPTVGSIYAPAGQMGLDVAGGPNSDCIDGLVVWDNNNIGSPVWGGIGAEPGVDFALFSLAHGSATLMQWNLGEGDIFFTDFTGACWLFASAQDLGLVGGGPFTDNVDALEVLIPGDANFDRFVDIGDLGILAANWNTPTGMVWQTADFNADGAADIGDLGVLAANWQQGSAPRAPVPEPAAVLVFTLGAAGLLRRRAR